MTYLFKSRATGNLIMLDTVGRRVLEILGKDPDAASGILTPEQIPSAIAALQAAVASEEAAGADARNDDEGGDEEEGSSARGPQVSLRQRVTPFIDMLRRSQAEGKEVVWGA